MTRRAQLLPEVRRLRDEEGLTWRAIGDRLGISLKYASDIYYDPDGAKKNARTRKWVAQYEGECEKCGVRISGATVIRGGSMCAPCYRASMTAAERERMDDIAQMWNQGASLKEIKQYMGYGAKSSPPLLSKMMALGLIAARRPGVRVRHAQRS